MRPACPANRNLKRRKLMHRTFIALAFAATAATTSLPTSAIAMENEYNMLTGAVYNSLRQFGVETDNIDQLTLQEIAELRTILSGDSMSEEQKRVRIRALLEDN